MSSIQFPHCLYDIIQRNASSIVYRRVDLCLQFVLERFHRSTKLLSLLQCLAVRLRSAIKMSALASSIDQPEASQHRHLFLSLISLPVLIFGLVKFNVGANDRWWQDAISLVFKPTLRLIAEHCLSTTRHLGFF